MYRTVSFRCLLGLALLVAWPVTGRAETPASSKSPASAPAPAPAFVPPPRTIADVTAILDQEKPDPAQLTRLRAEADAAPPEKADAAFYFKRAQARADLGRNADAIADTEAAIAQLHDPFAQGTFRMQSFLILQLNRGGEIKRAAAVAEQMARDDNEPHRFGRLFHVYRWQAVLALATGNVSAAEAYHRRQQDLMVKFRAWKTADQYSSAWAAQVEDTNARILQARGQYHEAELAFHRTQDLYRDLLAKAASWESPLPRNQGEGGLDYARANEGRAKARQGRFAEAEADIRGALLDWLHRTGKYNADTAVLARYLAVSLAEQGRYPEAEKLVRTAVEILQTLGYKDDSRPLVYAQAHLANVLNLEARFTDAAAVYAQVDAAVTSWDPAQVAAMQVDGSRAMVAYAAGSLDDGIAAARAFLARAKAAYGDRHLNTAIAHGILAIGLTRAGNAAEALGEFKAAIPVLLSVSREARDDEDALKAASDQRAGAVIEAYIGLLAQQRGQNAGGEAVAAETFRLADLIRGQSVQRALAESSARVSARDPALAALLRREQDLARELQAEVATLDNVLALPPAERADNTVKDLNALIDRVRADHDKARQEIGRRFPRYAELIDPKPPTVEEIRAALKPDEALLSFYFGRRESFVWAVPKSGPVAFARVPATAGELETKVRKLREAFELKEESFAAVPPFDLTLAHALYWLLLGPIEEAWRPARNIIVATNGALGLLPLSLLPTTPDLPRDREAPFSGYRNVAWLARTHAVTSVPSVAAFVTVRHLSQRSPAREKFIGFGDPYFSVEQARDAARDEAAAAGAAAAGTSTPAQVAAADGNETRDVTFRRRASPRTEGVDSADLAGLPRLPDTADELRAIALALGLDPQKVLHLGRDANERTVKTADLSRYRIVAFSTHGLVPGDINGLTQPALALTAPAVAGIEGDGLLTMGEILGLKLDADWVVLSACNTGAGAVAGAEAASGLGRAFFYAGTQALLVTNWSVHSASARALVSDLFRRQAADPALTKAEALRQSMIALIDGPGFADAAGKTLFSYAHPLFWAPYSIIGDGG